MGGLSARIGVPWVILTTLLLIFAIGLKSIVFSVLWVLFFSVPLTWSMIGFWPLPDLMFGRQHPLLAGLSEKRVEAREELQRRVNILFPPGTTEQFLIDELTRQGFSAEGVPGFDHESMEILSNDVDDPKWAGGLGLSRVGGGRIRGWSIVWRTDGAGTLTRVQALTNFRK